MTKQESIKEARMRLVEIGGKTSQDLGAGRIVGQILVYLYLQEVETSLDQIGQDLDLSKASVSIAVRQLEQLGLARKVWKGGDKKNYFRSADNIASALQKGVLAIVRQKVELFGEELDVAITLLGDGVEDTKSPADKEFLFLKQRILRAKKLQTGLDRVLGNPIVKLLTEIKI